MNLLNLVSGDWDQDLLEATAPDLRGKLPPAQPSATVAGKVSGFFVEKYGLNPGCEVVLFSGDNPCSLVGMGASRPGKVVISLGTSDTLFAAMPEPRTDPKGFGHVFGNPMGGFMSLICFLNGSLARERVKGGLGPGVVRLRPGGPGPDTSGQRGAGNASVLWSGNHPAGWSPVMQSTTDGLKESVTRQQWCVHSWRDSSST